MQTCKHCHQIIPDSFMDFASDYAICPYCDAVNRIDTLRSDSDIRKKPRKRWLTPFAQHPVMNLSTMPQSDENLVMTVLIGVVILFLFIVAPTIFNAVSQTSLISVTMCGSRVQRNYSTSRLFAFCSSVHLSLSLWAAFTQVHGWSTGCSST